MTMATLSQTAVTKATEIAQKTNANAVIIEMMVGEKLQQMAVSEQAYENRVVQNIEKIATVDPSGAIS